HLYDFAVIGHKPVCLLLHIRNLRVDRGRESLRLSGNHLAPVELLKRGNQRFRGLKALVSKLFLRKAVLRNMLAISAELAEHDSATNLIFSVAIGFVAYVQAL